jgi:hypothetical protein
MRSNTICIILCALLAHLTSGFLDDKECNSHGRIEDTGHCNCQNPFPDPGDKGWVGINCTIPVFGAKINESATSWCSHTADCNSLAPGEWACFNYNSISWDRPDNPWYYLTIFLQRTDEDDRSDPDLFGLFHDGPNATTSYIPSSSGTGYDFQDTSIGSHTTIVKKVSKLEFGPQAKDYNNTQGAYICVRAYGDAPKTTFELKTEMSRCPSDFIISTGTPLICSSPKDTQDEGQKRFDSCTYEGECVCRKPFARPTPAVFEHLGFEDCSAKVTIIETAKFAQSGGTVVIEHEHVRPDKWNFYQFDIEEKDFQVIVSALEEERGEKGGSGGVNNAGFIDLYLNAGQPPGFQAQQFDLRPGWNRATQDSSLEVAFDSKSTSAFRQGTWFAGIVGDHRASNYTITFTKNACPYNCSGNGSCDQQTHMCTCQKGYGGVDCSTSTRKLEFNTTIEKKDEDSLFEYEYWHLPPATEGIKNGNVEVVLEASFHSAGYGKWLEVRPSILLLGSSSSSSSSPLPTSSNYSHQLTLNEQNIPRRLSICSSEYKRYTNWTLAVFNPVRNTGIGYNLTLHKIPKCFNNCCGHGECSEDGVCLCDGNYAGGDCSVEIQSGGDDEKKKHSGRGGGSTFMSWLFGVVMGGVGVMMVIWYEGGLPSWMPLRQDRRYMNLGLYQELSDVEGI